MNGRALIAEFVGTFALIFVGVGAIAANSVAGGGGTLLGVALAHGLTIAVMVAATAAISGGHLNPAVTIGALVTKKIDPMNAVGYVVAQCLGAIVGAAAIKAALPNQLLLDVGMGTPALAGDVTGTMGILIEGVLTFFLMFVVYGTAIDPRGPGLAGLFIGLTVALDILVAGPFTGGAMNPARHLGPALLGGGGRDILVYWIGPVSGAIAAALLYHHLLEKLPTELAPETRGKR
jgi:MIP family channel proteins